MDNYGSIRNRSTTSQCVGENTDEEFHKIEITSESQTLISIHVQKKGFGVRHVQVLMTFLGLVVAYSLRINLSVAIVAMTNNSSNPNFPQLDWNPKAKGAILSSYFWGYLITQVPAGNLSRIYGSKLILFVGLLVCGIATLLTPFVALHGNWMYFCASRVFQGMFQGVIYPSTNTHLARWVPPLERNRLISFVFSGAQFGTVVTLFIAGYLAASPFGWPSIFYLTGAAAVLWSVMWLCLGADSPESHSTISLEERTYIKASLITVSSDGSLMATPWKDIATSVPVWALFLCHCGQNWGYWTLLTQTPSYMSHALGFDIKTNGALSALPYLSMFILTIILPLVADYISAHNILSKSVTRKMWNTIAHCGGAIALIMLAQFGTSITLSVVLLTVSVALNGCVYMGFLSNHLDLSPVFAGVLMGITNGFSNLTSILGPLVAGFIVTDETNVHQWNVVFYISAAIFFIGNLIFVVFGSTEIQYWNEPRKKQGIENIECTVE